MNRWPVGIPLLALLLFSFVNPTAAQVNASISGRVEDASGAAVPGAMVSVTSLETGVTRTLTTEADGTYRALSLSVGRYEVKVEKVGFKVELQSGIDLAVGQQAVVNLNLEVGQVQQQVTVTGEAPLINVTTATSTSGLVGEKAVKDLPLNGRSFDSLITLNAGAANVTALKGYTVGAGGAGADQANQFAVSGRRWSENLFLLNGVEYPGPSAQHTEPGGVSGQLLGIDAVREFNVVSDTYGAEYGKRSGAQVSIATQSGTNGLHGSAFEFLRNSVMDARNYFDHPVGKRIPPFKRNQFGGALGGPIQKDKTFVFGNYEGFRQRLGVSNTSVVPDNCSRAGRTAPAGQAAAPFALSQCLGVVANQPAANAAGTSMVAIIDAYYPVPNGPELGNGIADAFYNPLQSIQEDFGTTRVDHTFSDKDTLGAVYTIDNGISTTPVVDPLFAQQFHVRSQLFTLQETHIFSSNFINNATFGLARAGFIFNAVAYTPLPKNLDFLVQSNSDYPGQILFTSGNVTQGGGLTSTNQTAARTSFTYADGIQIIRGRNQISAGIWFYQLGANELAPVTQGGQVTFASITTALQGTAAQFGITPVQTPMHWRQLEGAWYVQDSVQVRRNLSIRIGLRHEFTNGWNEKYNRASNYVFGPNDVLLTTPVVGSSPYTENNSKLLFGPRIGLAWDPFGKGKSSVRAAFGTYYDFNDVLGQGFLDRLPPFNGQANFAAVPFLPLVPFNSSNPVPPPCGPGVAPPCTTFAVSGIQTTLKTPTVQEWSLAVEQQITTNSSLRIGYVGEHGYHLGTTADPNQIFGQICANAAGCSAGGTQVKPATSTAAAVPAILVPQGTLYVPAAGPVGSTTTATLPNPFLAIGSSLYDVVNSNYDGLNVEFTHRFSAGLQFKAAYTYSKDLDISTGLQGEGEGTVQGLEDTNDPNLDYGPSSDNQTHKFVVSGGYELPFGSSKPFLRGFTGARNKLVSGWQFNWIFTYTSGLPFTLAEGPNQAGNGETGRGIAQRPSRNPAFTGPVITHNISQWFNPTAFILPPIGTYGNFQRNSLIGPNFQDVDISIFKTTAINERFSVQFRAEAFNVLNRANFGNPNQTVFTATGAVSGSAGQIITAAASRQLQMGLKLVF